MRFLSAAVLALSSTLVAQQPASPPAQRPAMADARLADQVAGLSKLDFMLGTWKGSGWMILGPGRRAEFNQTEIVKKKLDGALITIDGDGRDAADPSRHIHSAFATVTYMPASSAYRFMQFSGGNMLDVTATVAARTFVWGFDAPYGKTRFTLDYTSGDWHEIGELSRDGGQTWTKNFEMTLKKGNDDDK